MRKVVLECKNVGKKIGDKLIINDISLEVREGTIMGLIGPNGSGKTTLMKLILGLQELSSGEIIINGYKKTECFEQAIKDVGTIIENPDMYMYLTGYQNLKLVANLYNKKHTDIIRISKIVGINTYLNKKIKKYSLGMRQCLGLAQALLIEPKLLILDEPFNGLDPIIAKRIMTILKILVQKHKVAILVSSHILGELEHFCTHICLIQNGKIIKSGETSELLKNPDSYLVKLNDLSVLKRLRCPYQILSSNLVRININKEYIPKIIERIVVSGTRIYEIKEEKRTLEDLFLNEVKKKC